MTNPPTAKELDALYAEKVFTLDGNDGYYEDDATNLAAARARRKWIEEGNAECGMRNAECASAGAGRMSLLDIGCGYGHFLAVLDPALWDARGIDVGARAVEEARRRFGVRCEALRIEEVPEEWHGRFDVVTMWDVIEHVPDPAAFLARAAGLLREGGRLFLSTPDLSAPVARLLGRRWHYLDPMQHLCLFSRDALRRLCDQSGLTMRRRRSFGRRYTLDYLLYRSAYCYDVPVLQRAAGLGRRWLGPLGAASIPVRLGDIVAIEAERGAFAETAQRESNARATPAYAATGRIVDKDRSR